MWSHRFGWEAASDLPKSTLTGSQILQSFFLQTRRHLEENPAKTAKSGSLCSQIMDRRLARIRWVKRVVLPGFARLLKSRACVEQLILWSSLCFTYTCTHKATQRPQSCGAASDPDSMVTAPVTTPPL